MALQFTAKTLDYAKNPRNQGERDNSRPQPAKSATRIAATRRKCIW